MKLPDTTLISLCQWAEQGDFLVLGELHGTQEMPKLLSALLDTLAQSGYRNLAFEIPRSEQRPFQDWAHGTTSVIPTFFARPSHDGRGNAQVMTLAREAAAKGWRLLCFDLRSDQSAADWQERDYNMAANLTTERQASSGKVVAVCGNLHSRLTPSENFSDCWPSFAVRLQELNPKARVITVNVAFHSGSFYNGRVQEVQGEPLAAPEIRDGTADGHSITLHLPHATPVTFLTEPT